jgi:hypothetical protein
MVRSQTDVMYVDGATLQAMHRARLKAMPQARLKPRLGDSPLAQAQALYLSKAQAKACGEQKSRAKRRTHVGSNGCGN